MAHTLTNNDVSYTDLGFFGRFSAKFGDWLTGLGETNQRVRQVRALMALSDQELADRGLRREDVARYVFVDCYWV